jgi:transcriptional regulator with XRE-family HTH domain
MPHRKPTRPPLIATRRNRKPPVTPLQSLRIARNRTQAELAQDVGCGESTIALWEALEREPSAPFRVAYARALGIDVTQLGAIVYATTADHHAVGMLTGAVR